MSYGYNNATWKYISASTIQEWFSEGKEGIERILLHVKSIVSCPEYMQLLLKLICTDFDANMAYINRLAYSENLQVRYYFMHYIVVNFPEKWSLFYDDITKFLTISNPSDPDDINIMRCGDISELAVAIFNSNIDKDVWKKLKKFILDNYDYNELASKLLSYKTRTTNSIQEFMSDSDVLFNSSGTMMPTVFYTCEELKIESASIRKFREHIIFFQSPLEREFLFHLHYIFQYGLWNQLVDLIDKYFAISDDKTFCFVAGGSTAACYRIGDYVFKLVRYKHSYEESVCPDIFLVHKNLEQVHVKDERGVVKAGIEVQKFLKKNAKDVPDEFFECFEQELRNAGFELHDNLIGGDCGDNCMLLDSYLDANHHNPECLPDWFKIYPLVLIDHDLVFPINLERAPKHLRD